MSQPYDVIRCPACNESVLVETNHLRCVGCARRLPIHTPPIDFLDDAHTSGFFDRLAPIYETPLWFGMLYRLLVGPGGPPDDRTWFQQAVGPDAEAVLDVGCGTGRLLRYVAADMQFGWGIDLSAGMLRRAAARTSEPHVHYARMQAEGLYFADASFDAVICAWAIHLFADPAAALSEMRRVLHSDGRVAGSTLTPGGVLRVRPIRSVLGRTLDTSTFGEHTLTGMLVEAGFAPPHLERYGAGLFFIADTG